MSEIVRLLHPEPDTLDDMSLPGWVYHDPDYFRVEMARLIRPSWQIVCHANDIPDAGDWRTLERSAPSPMSAAIAARASSTARRAARSG
jgi:hypothetical protein